LAGLGLKIKGISVSTKEFLKVMEKIYPCLKMGKNSGIAGFGRTAIFVA